MASNKLRKSFELYIYEICKILLNILCSIYYFHLLCFSFRLVAKLEEKSPDQVEIFKTNMNKVMKDILGRFKELQFFTGESMDIDGMVGLMEYRDIDGNSLPVMMFFKHGLEEEKF